MRVGVYYSNTDIRIEERPIPEIGSGEILVKIEASGICGSDVMEWYRIHRVPLVLGHEIAGTVVKTGGNVRNIKVGDRVSAAHHVPCGQCRYCKTGHETVCETLRKTNFDPGGFSEYVRVPEINTREGVFLLPRDLSFEEATFIEPLACVLRGQRLAGFRKGMTVLVIGSGISGILHIKLARANLAARVFATDISDFRLNAAQNAGCDDVFRADQYFPENLRSLNGGFLADLVIICASAQNAFLQGIRSVERGGTILIFSAASKDAVLPAATNDIFWRNEVTVISSYAGSPYDHREALNMIASGKISARDMITHRFGLNDIVKGFRLVNKADDSIKVIIEPQK